MTCSMRASSRIMRANLSIWTKATDLSQIMKPIAFSARTPTSTLCNQCRQLRTRASKKLTLAPAQGLLSVSSHPSPSHAGSRRFSASRQAATDSRMAKEALPSHRDRQRGTLSKRFSKLMDDVQGKLVLASQRVNNYTGTDYSGIQSLREDIKEQGQLRWPAIVDHETTIPSTRR
jgi:hypothetical protein